MDGEATAGARAPLPKVIIDSVEFDGPIHLSEARREKVVAELKQQEFNPDSNWIGKIEEGGVRGAWQEEGYFKVNGRARAQVLSADETAQHVSLAIHVDEGLQYRLGDMRLREADPDNPELFPEEELRKLIPLNEGEVFNVARIREGLDALRKLYISKGYIDFTATPLTEVDEVRQRISVVLELDEQKQFRVGNVEVVGLDPRTESLLRSKLEPGHPLNWQVVEDFYKDNKSLLPAGASPADDQLRRNVKEGTVDLVLDFRTCPPPED